MRKCVLMVTVFITICSVLVAAFFSYSYLTDKRVEKKIGEIQELESRIEELKKEIDVKNQEKEEAIQMNHDKGKILNLWQKELQKVKA